MTLIGLYRSTRDDGYRPPFYEVICARDSGARRLRHDKALMADQLAAHAPVRIHWKRQPPGLQNFC
jgi:hypothetical protein